MAINQHHKINKEIRLNKLIILLFLLISSVQAKNKCQYPGDVGLWEFAYCQTVAETDDCESSAVSNCLLGLDKKRNKKLSICDQKKFWRIESCKQIHKNQQTKAYKECLKQTPSIVKNDGCS